MAFSCTRTRDLPMGCWKQCPDSLLFLVVLGPICYLAIPSFLTWRLSAMRLAYLVLSCGRILHENTWLRDPCSTSTPSKLSTSKDGGNAFYEHGPRDKLASRATVYIFISAAMWRIKKRSSSWVLGTLKSVELRRSACVHCLFHKDNTVISSMEMKERILQVRNCVFDKSATKSHVKYWSTAFVLMYNEQRCSNLNHNRSNVMLLSYLFCHLSSF